MARHRVLVVGRTGQLARALAAHPWPEGIDVACLGRDALDLADPAQARTAAGRADLVVNAAAYTAVDKAESEAEAAFALNRDGPAALAEGCAAQAIPLVHVSTDYVFDGTKAGPYVESDPVNPLSVYGRSKEEGEAAIRRATALHVILRTSWVFSPYGHNFVRTMLRLGAERPRLAVVDDQHGGPTAAGDIAAAIARIATGLLAGETGYGTFHFAGRPTVSWHGFATAIFAEAAGRGARVPGEIAPIGTEDYPTPAVRPRNSVLDCGAIRATWGIEAPDWRPKLSAAIDAFLQA